MSSQDYQRIETAIRFLETHAIAQPSLDDVAGHVGLSAFHLQRLFKRWAGVSPKRFLQYLTIEHAKLLLRASTSVLETSYAVGLSGPGRLHDLFVNVEAVTPGEYKTAGSRLAIHYAFHQTPFGDCLLAQTSRGICHLGFCQDGEGTQTLEDLRSQWAGACFTASPGVGREAIEQIFATAQPKRRAPLRVVLKGTNFQLKVWQALLRIPEGRVVSYGSLAEAIGHPGAHRAVGSAVGHNPVAYLIPCHRVLRASGELGGYRWGTARKRALLAYESAHR